MNNEEKILTMLAQMQSDLSSVKEKLVEVDQRSIRTQVLLEAEYCDKLQLLYEGHSAIMQKLDELAPKSRVEALEDDVAMMKDVIKLMRQEISELKKAQ